MDHATVYQDCHAAGQPARAEADVQGDDLPGQARTGLSIAVCVQGSPVARKVNRLGGKNYKPFPYHKLWSTA